MSQTVDSKTQQSTLWDMSRTEDIMALVKANGIVTAELLTKQGFSRRILSRMVQSGELVRVAHGIYAAADGEDITPHHSLAVAARRAPGGVICLISALRFHDIGTQLPHEVWMGFPSRSRLPAEAMIHAVHYSPDSFGAGIERHRIEGVDVPIYSPAKTVADCFKYRNQIGLEAAIEALREAIQGNKTTIADIHEFASICRVRTVITPYLQALA
jgi:predicted transcriptional regulator of viral defense system